MTVREKTVSFGECDLCAAAFASAERTHFVAGTDTRVHLNGSVSERVEVSRPLIFWATTHHLSVPLWIFLSIIITLVRCRSSDGAGSCSSRGPCALATCFLSFGATADHFPQVSGLGGAPQLASGHPTSAAEQGSLFGRAGRRPAGRPAGVSEPAEGAARRGEPSGGLGAGSPRVPVRHCPGGAAPLGQGAPGRRLPGHGARLRPAVGRSAFAVPIVPSRIFIFGGTSPAAHLWLCAPALRSVLRPQVLASRTHAGETPYRDFACSRGGSGSKPALLNSHELTRPILGALLEAGWGVVPTHRAWSEAQGRLVPDYVFSVGHTPFGPLAKGDSLSFAERDAAARSGVLATLNATVHGARKALEAFGRFPDADARLGREDRAALGARWHVLRHKLQRSARALGMQRWDVAVHYARSAGHDAAALERVLGAAGERLVTRLDCFQERPALATWVRVAGVLVGGRAALWAAKAAMPLLFGKRQHGKLF